MASEPLSPTLSFYAKYIKPRYCSDPVFKQKLIARSQEYTARMRCGVLG